MNNVELKDFLDFNYLAALKTSPNKEKSTFVKSKARYEDNDYTHDLYLFEKGSYKRLMSLGKDSRTYWEGDQAILFHHSNNKEDQAQVEATQTVLYRFNLETQEIEKAMTLRLPIGSLKHLHKTQYLVQASLSETDHLLLDAKQRDAHLKQQKDETYFEYINEVPFYVDGGTFTRQKRSQYFIYDSEADTYTALFAPNESASLVYHDEKTQVAYFDLEVAKGVPTFTSKIVSIDLMNMKQTVLYDKGVYSIGHVSVLNGKLYCLANDMKDHGINQNSDFYIIEDGDLRKVCDFGLSAWNSVGSDARLGASQSREVVDNVYYFVGTYRDRTHLYRFDGTQVEVVSKAKGALDGMQWQDKQWYGIGMFGNGLQELYRIDGDDVTPITSFNKSYETTHSILEPIHVPYENDGVELDGWVILPKNYDASRTYPSILDIHGGPKTIYNDGYYHEMQVWANKGYIVYFCNPRGGDVYGNDFMDIRGKYGTVDYEDIMAFVDVVSESYALDTKRMGVTGGSYGGFMTNWIVSHTDRFQAAATQRSISNWISFYGTSDIGSYFASDQTDSDIYTSLDAMWEQSPLKHAENISTPLLFIHSDEDYRCPIEQAMQLFTVIKMRGVETEFYWFKEESHGLSRGGRPKARVKRLEAITNWMEKHLG